MAEQSQSAFAVQGTAPAGSVFQTPIVRIGRGGLQLNKAIDDLTLEECQGLSNLYTTGAEMISRLGQTLTATFPGAVSVHSIRRLSDPRHASYTHFWGAGTAWYRSGGAQLAAGLSGNPLTLLPVRPPFSGEPWMVAADSNAMWKASATSPAVALGLPAPASCTTALGAAQKFPIEAFDTSDGSQAAQWQIFGGLAPTQLYSTAGTGVLPYSTVFQKTDVPGVSGNGVKLTGTFTGPVPGAGWTVGMGIAYGFPRNFSAFTVNGTSAITDDDLLHLALKINLPSNVGEVRIYFVCSPYVFAQPYASPATWSLPGMGIGNFSPSAYLLTLRPSDYTNALLAAETFQSAADRVRTAQFLETFSDPVAAAIATQPSAEAGAGAGVWSTFSGVVTGSDGKTYQLPPIKRGDLAKIGTAGQAGSDWTAITGMYITVTSVTQSSTQSGITFDAAFDDMYFTGGSGPDTTEPGSQKFDYRVTNYDPRTGARSNGSPIQSGAPGATAMAPDATLDAARQPITIAPAAYADPAIRQEAYRRGGVLNDNWYFVAVNTANGGAITDTFDDTALLNVATIPLTNFQPVSTVDNAGNTILAQPLPVVFGPFDDGTICGLGDPYRPGYLYASLPGQIDHWPSTGGYAIEVCSPSEELLNGCLIGGSGFVLSRERGYTVYTNLSGGTGVVATPSGCVPGLAARWGFCKGPGGVFYVAKDGVRVTGGSDSTILSDAIRPLFHGETKNGFLPIDFSVPAAIRLEVHDMDLWFLYQDTGGTRRSLVYSLLYRYWRNYTFATPLACCYADENQGENDAQGQLQLLLGGYANSQAYRYAGFTDNGTAIPYQLRTGAWHWNHPREEKLLGDLIVEGTLQGTTLTVATFLNNETIVNTGQTATGGAQRAHFTFDPFGTTPQHARNVSIDFSGAAPATAQISLALAGMSFLIQPEVTMNRVTAWEALAPTESYLYACCLDCDTGGTPRTINVEYDLAGNIGLAAVLTVNSNGRHKLWFSWPAVHAQLVRLRPSGTCQPWMIWNAEWIGQPEPPRIAGWDTNFEDLGDSYYTGLDLQVDTFGATKTLQVYVDQVLIATPTITATGRTHLHVSFTPGRGHIYRFVAVDTNPGLLYAHQWIVEAEPLEQTNWNAPYTVWDSLSDKYLKGIIFEVDTYGLAKTVNIEVDQVVVTTVQVQTSGRTVTNVTFPQVLGRVFRIIPSDIYASRLYTAQPIFDEEPFSLGRWETQLLDFDLPGSGWGSLVSMDLCYKATAGVFLTCDIYDAIGRLLQTVSGRDILINGVLLPATGGAKQKHFVVFPANKGVLFKLVATSQDGSGVTVYREESRVRLQPWSGNGAVTKALGDDDLDPTRQMTKAIVAAGRQGGTAR